MHIFLLLVLKIKLLMQFYGKCLIPFSGSNDGILIASPAPSLSSTIRPFMKNFSLFLEYIVSHLFVTEN